MLNKIIYDNKSDNLQFVRNVNTISFWFFATENRGLCESLFVHDVLGAWYNLQEMGIKLIILKPFDIYYYVNGDSFIFSF